MQLRNEDPNEEWRRVFTDRIMELAANEADVLQVADWAIQAQTVHGGRNATEVAGEQWRSGVPPIPE